MSIKKRILWASESSFLSTGYGTYSNEVLKRLYASNKYEIAEFASYAMIGDPRTPPWKFYANHVDGSDPRYGTCMGGVNQFGAWRFERVVLDFRCHILCGIRDFWMDFFMSTSALRPYYKHIWMPTVDSAPQKEEWMDRFLDADAILTYSEFGRDTLLNEGGDKIKFRGVASPCASEVFKPVLNKGQHKQKHGLSPEVFIVGTVMRNQGRKLYPDLFAAYKLLQEKNPELAKKTYLYCHTSYPDNGWKIPSLLKEYGIANRVLFTYLCTSCHNYFPSFFQDARTTCKFCGSYSAITPKSTHALNTEQLAEVMNLFDVYVQYANSEGFGCPIVEAASCGVPVMVVDYSAMPDIANKVGGYPIKVQRFFREVELNALRALPDNSHFVELLEKYLTQPESMRRKKSVQTANLTRKHYNWDATAKVWMDYFDSVEVEPIEAKWNSPPDLISPPPKLPDDASHAQFVEWVCVHVLKDPKLINNYFGLTMLQNLDNGFFFENNNMNPFGKPEALARIEQIANNKMQCEQARCGMIPLTDEDYINFANRARA